MPYPSPWEHKALVVRHHYYDGKPSFERETDTYEQWSAFAVEDGEFEYRIGPEEGRATVDEILVCPPGIPFHRYTARPISFHYFLFHWVDDNGQASTDQDYAEPAHLRFDSAERLRATLATIRPPALAPHPAYRQWLNHILLDLFRQHAMEQLVPALPERCAGQDPRMEKARRMLDTACDAPLSVGSVAEAHGMSAVQFTRRFQQAYGVTPSAYIESIRLGKARHLLTHSSLTIEQVALACGYSNGFYFCRVFANRLHMPPSEYRNMHRI
ncbi:helix-turn-helix domain-containing protein [Paenibacillus sp. 1P07SE]|uniref:helix-turn-helix domain-containing protein n=1 Tax=Paenibacillus sp. 1P07SE TaxID=3132209 RepID=UPI0039A4791A